MGRKSKPARITFDENARREFVTGFHKRKVERRKKFNEKLEQELKEAKKRIKLQAREMTRRMTNLPVEDERRKLPSFEKYYELPEHIVQVRELFPSDVPKNEETGSESECDHDTNVDVPLKTGDDIIVPGMQLDSVKSVKKMVSKQSAVLMQRDRAFRKMRKIERTTNRKQAAKKRKVAEKKEKKSRKRKHKR